MCAILQTMFPKQYLHNVGRNIMCSAILYDSLDKQFVDPNPGAH